MKCLISPHEVSFMMEFFKIPMDSQSNYSLVKLKENLAIFAESKKIIYAFMAFGGNNEKTTSSVKST